LPIKAPAGRGLLHVDEISGERLNCQN